MHQMYIGVVLLPIFLPSLSSKVVFLPFHAFLVSILSSGPFLQKSSSFVAIKRSLRGLSDWMGLGLELGMDFAFLQSIIKSHGNDVEKCKTTMVHSWLKTGEGTKGKLVDALRRMGEENIADKLEKSKGTCTFNLKS